MTNRASNRARPTYTTRRLALATSERFLSHKRARETPSKDTLYILVWSELLRRYVENIVAGVCTAMRFFG
jgi:hypothetical protein